MFDFFGLVSKIIFDQVFKKDDLDLVFGFQGVGIKAAHERVACIETSSTRPGTTQVSLP